MTRPIILLNGQPIPFRLLNATEQEKLDRDRAAGKRIREALRERGKISPGDPEWCEACFDEDVGLCEVHSGKHQFQVHLLVTPEAGDDLTYTDLPEGYDELRVRWKDSKGDGTFHMRIDHAV